MALNYIKYIAEKTTFFPPMLNLSKIFAGMSWGMPWKYAHQKQLLVLGLCALAGALAGLACSGMHQLAEMVFFQSRRLLEACGDSAHWVEPALPVAGIFFCVILGQLFWRRHPYDTNLWTAIRQARYPGRGLREYHMLSHILTCGVAVGLGISAGMEAPSALTGASIGDNLGRKLGLPRENRTLLLCAGAAAAISAVFSAPLAGALFACEVLLPGTAAVTLIPLLIASAAGAILSQLCGVNVRFPEIAYSWHLGNLWLYLSMGLVCGAASVAVIRLNCQFQKLRRAVGNPWLMAIGGSMMLYGIFLLLPMVGGNGLNFVLELMHGNLSALPGGVLDVPSQCGWMLLGGFALCVLIKPIVSMISISSGGDGGMFAPSLVTGAFMGIFFHQLLGMADITGFPLINCMAAGMAGMLAGVMHAPMTGLFLIVELLGGYQLFVPLMVVVAISTFASRCLSRGNIYFAAADILRNPDTDPCVNEDGTEQESTPVGEVADRNSYTLSPQDTFRTLLKVLLHSPQEIFPVLDQNNRLVGIIQERNIRPYLLDTKLYDILVADDFMGAVPGELPYEATIAEATRVFDATGAEFIPITRDHKFYGLLTRAQLLECHRTALNHQELF